MSTATEPRDDAPAARAGTGAGAADRPGAARRGARGRGERSPLASAGLHAALATAALVAVFPIAYMVFVSLRGGTAGPGPPAPRAAWRPATMRTC